MKNFNNDGKQETGDGKRGAGNSPTGPRLGQDVHQTSAVDQEQILGGLGEVNINIHATGHLNRHPIDQGLVAVHLFEAGKSLLQ